MWKEATDLLLLNPAATSTYLPQGRAPACGEVFRNADLAATLSLISRQGGDTFYQGRVAQAIAATAKEYGGLLSSEDLADHRSEWVKPLSVKHKEFDVWQLPPNTQGLVVLEMLQILAGFDLATLNHNSADYIHLLVEAKKLAFADRDRYLADPAVVDVPISRLLSPSHAAAQRARVDPARAANYEPGSCRDGLRGDTVYIAAVDGSRNAVSLIQSVYYNFGSGIVPRGMGFVMQNRGYMFRLEPDHPNRLEPRKRPLTTIIPGFVTRDSLPVFAFGVMGGDQQPQGQVQILENILDFGMDAQQAGDAFRFSHGGAFSAADGSSRGAGTVFLEPGIPDGTARGLRARGHQVEYRKIGYDARGGIWYGGYQGVWIDPDTGVLFGGSEPRKDGCAIGY